MLPPLATKARYEHKKSGIIPVKEGVIPLSVLHVGVLPHYSEVAPQCGNRLDLTSPQNKGSNRCGWTDKRGFHSCAPLSLRM